MIDCDDNCEARKIIVAEEKKRKDEEHRLLEEKRNREELLLYEKKLGAKKYKERKARVAEQKNDGNLWKILLISAFVVLSAVLAYFILWN